ncbi:MAG: cupin domain-containing protein [Bacteroidales bacterium]|jgi:predicted cupin superfamily sugar epimerase|nr:cupin domain-containing protein [Bacteroidales bacterium]
MNVTRIIEKLDLQPHPEGGFYKETYRSDVMHGRHHISTAIYFLLPRGHISHLHRIGSDEIWHFYLGGAIELIELTPDKKLRKTILGNDIEAGQILQHGVPAGHWFGAMPCQGTEFALVGCTVAPGFGFEDFELANKEYLLAEFPAAHHEIEKYFAL